MGFLLVPQSLSTVDGLFSPIAILCGSDVGKSS